MISGKKVVVVMPAYNAEKTLLSTYSEVDRDLVDEVVLVDDASHDDTVALARKIGIKHVIRHEKNLGYGGNQKTCYKAALDLGADIVIMLHPDYQYTPKLIPAMADLISSGLYHCVLGSRILGAGAIRNGMPLYKYAANRLLTCFQNIMIRYKLTEYHTGYRAFSREVLEQVNLERTSNDYIFDNEMLSLIIYAGYDIAEITCPTKYFADASSINFFRSCVYGVGVVRVSLCHFLQRTGLARFSMYERPAKKTGRENEHG